MKFVNLLLKSLFRNKMRALLTISSIAAALFLVTTLLALLDNLKNPPETPDSALRLITRHKISLMNSLPIAYREKIANVEGVEAVVGSMWFGGVVDNKGVEQPIAQFAVTTDDFFVVNPDIVLPEEQKQAFLTDRAAALAGNNVADIFGWKVGDTVHFKSNLFPVTVELNIVGLYSEGPDKGSSVYFNWDYFNEALQNNGIMGTFSIRAASADEVPRVAERVDALFKNSIEPTLTETEKAFQLSFVSMLGNVQLLISSICLAVIFAVILIAANTMAMAIRERIREIGILKALGFRSNLVLGLLVSESLLLALIGTVLGSFGARLLFGSVNMMAVTGGFIQQLNVSAFTLGLCTLIGVLIGALAAGFPAWQAARRPVVAALRRI